jgi:drug/metabolite transporter (DMT)-like permease
MILYTYTTFLLLIGAVLFGERISRTVVIALLITYVGTAIIFGHDLSAFGDDVVIGGIFIVGSAISFAFYLLFSKSMIKQVGSRLFTCIALLAASIAILGHFSITHSVSDINISDRAVVLVLIIAIFCTVIPTFFTTAAVARIGADRTGIVATVGPAFTSLAAVLVLSEAFTGYHLAGIILTIMGVSILQRK